MSSAAVAWCSLALACCGLLRVSCEPVTGFLPYGVLNGDASLAPAESSAVVSLGLNLSFLGSSYSTAHINADGVISFGGPAPSQAPGGGVALLAPFWADVDTSSSGSVFYRVSRDADLLGKLSSTINAGFSSVSSVSLNWALLVTWSEVSAAGGSNAINNTFQCIVTSNGTMSFALFLYKSMAMHWSRASLADSQYAAVGLSAGDNWNLLFPVSRTEHILDLTRSGNTDFNGQWLFRVDKLEVQHPVPIVGMETVRYLVAEADGSVEVCAVVYAGTLTADAVITMQTRDGNAKAGRRDYRASAMELTFAPGGAVTRQCMTITVTGDSTVEADEYFTVSLRAAHRSLVLFPATTNVVIVDDDVVEVSLFNDFLSADEERGFVSVCAKMHAVAERDVTAYLELLSDTAIEGVDYAHPGNGSCSGVRDFIFNSKLITCVRVCLIDNSLYDVEGRLFRVQLNSTDKAVIPSTKHALINITDNDGPSVVIGFKTTEYTTSESNGTAVVCAHIRSGQVTRNIEVRISTDIPIYDGSNGVPAHLGADYLSAETILTIQPGLGGSRCLSIPLVMDSTLEDTESFIIAMEKVNPDLEYKMFPHTTRVTMTDADNVTVSLDEAQIIAEEANTSLRRKVCAHVYGKFEINIKLVLSTYAGNATAGQDYKPDSMSITVKPGHKHGCTRLHLIADNRREELYETFGLLLSAQHPRVFVNRSHAQVIIKDTDELLLKPFYSPEWSNISEANQNVSRFCVILQGQLATEVFIRFHTINATAFSGEDFIGFNRTETIYPENITTNNFGGFCIPFYPVNDIIVEGTESFFVVMTPVSDRVRPKYPGNDRIKVDIQDDDVVRIKPSSTSYHVLEDAGHVEVCVTMLGLAERPVNITLETVNGTAKEGVDYVMGAAFFHFPSYLDTYGHLTPSQVKQFSHNPPSSTACVNIAILDDELLESERVKFFTIGFSSNSLTSRSLKMPSDGVTVFVEDNDMVLVSLHPDPILVEEGVGQVVVRAYLSGLADFPISASVSTRPFTTGAAAQPKMDYTMLDGSTITFGAWSQSTKLTVTILEDAVLEDVERFELFLSVNSTGVGLGKPSTLPISIQDNDYAQVGVQEMEYRVLEGAGNVSICCQLTGPTGKVVTLDVLAVQGTAQENIDYYFHPPVTLTFPPSLEPSQVRCLTFSVIDDSTLEAVENLELIFSTRDARVNVTRATTTVSLVDDDSVYVSLTQTGYRVEEEGGGDVEVCVELVGRIETTVTVELSTEPGTAQATTDFQPTSLSLDFPPSSSLNQSVCATMTVVRDDAIVEDTETFYILLNTTNTSVSANINQMRVSIVDTDTVSVALEQSLYSLSEGEGEVSVCAALGAPTERAVQVQITTIGDTAQSGVDFDSTAIDLTFEAASSSHQCAPISIIDDAILENVERFGVSLVSSDPALSSINSSAVNRSAVVVIADDDRVVVGLDNEEQVVAEEQGRVGVCVGLRGGVEREVVVELYTEPGTARADKDFTAHRRSLTFQPASSVNQTICRTFIILNDTIVESVERFVIRLTTRDGDVDVGTDAATVSIVDNDTVSVALEQPIYSLSEGEGEVRVCAVLGAPVERRVGVQITSSGGTARSSADFDPTTANVMFEAASSTRQCARIGIVNDAILEDVEQFGVRLVIPDTALYLAGGEEDGRAVVLIVDDDHVTVGVSVNRNRLDEAAGSVEVCATLDGEMEKNITVSMETVVGTAKADTDFVHVSKDMMFDPSSGPRDRRCVGVELVDNQLVEREERFSVVLSSPLEGRGVLLDPKTVRITITDTDVVCPKDWTTSPRGNYAWPETIPGLRVELRCTKGMGVAWRRCDPNGVWKKENVEVCYGKTWDLFFHLNKLPFTCENFYELLRTVRQATKEKDFHVSYMNVVARYFRDFAMIITQEGYIVEKQTCHNNVQTFTTGIDIIDQLHKWNVTVLWTNSTSIMKHFEMVSVAVASNPKSASKSISKEHIAFSSTMEKKESLENNGIERKFAKPRGTLYVQEVTKSTISPDAVLGSIHLPASLFKKVSGSGSIGVWFSLQDTANFFPNYESILVNESVNTPVISATVAGKNVDHLDDPILFSLRLLNESVTGVTCVSWDYEKDEWTHEGCKTGIVDENGMVNCSCTHLTNFACLVDINERLEPGESNTPPEAELALSIISIVGIMLSLVGLTITIFTLLAFRKLRTRDSTKFRVQLCVSLTLLLVVFVGQVVIDYTHIKPQDIPIPCSVLSALTHYFTLTSLLWMGAEAVLMFRKLVLVFGVISKTFYVVTSLVAWGLPIPFVVVPAAINRDWMVSEDLCFISHFPVFISAFLAPIGVILILNTVVFLSVLSVLIRHASNKHRTKESGYKKKATIKTLLNGLAIMTLFGLTWVFGAFTFINSEASLAFHFLFAFFNSLQGCFIFIFFCLLAKETRDLWQQACCGKQKKHQLTTQTTTLAKFLSMESLGKAPGVESDDEDYPDKVKKYNEFDVTYIDRKTSLIKQKFTIAFRSEGNGNENNNEVANGSATGQTGSNGSNGTLAFHSFSPLSQELPSTASSMAAYYCLDEGSLDSADIRCSTQSTESGGEVSLLESDAPLIATSSLCQQTEPTPNGGVSQGTHTEFQ